MAKDKYGNYQDGNQSSGDISRVDELLAQNDPAVIKAAQKQQEIENAAGLEEHEKTRLEYIKRVNSK